MTGAPKAWADLEQILSSAVLATECVTFVADKIAEDHPLVAETVSPRTNDTGRSSIADAPSASPG